MPISSSLQEEGGDCVAVRSFSLAGSGAVDKRRHAATGAVQQARLQGFGPEEGRDAQEDEDVHLRLSGSSQQRTQWRRRRVCAQPPNCPKLLRGWFVRSYSPSRSRGQGRPRPRGR